MYEVKTPAIVESMEAARAVISGLQDGSMEPNHAAKIVSAARVLQSGVATDIKARIAAPKIAAQEARLINGEPQPQIAAS